MSIRRILAHKVFSGFFLLGPVAFFVGLVIAGLVPWWTPPAYYALSIISMFYYRRIRLPHLQREAVVLAMFGFVNCPHGNYLPDDPCGPCGDKWLTEHIPALAQNQNQMVTPSGETIH